MARSSFWVGVATGAAGIAVGLWAKGLVAQESMVRVERSVKIARPASEIFAACAHIERMPELVRGVVSIAADGDVSYWIADVEGHRFEWDVEIVQVIANQVIGWKSHRGPRHSGRINFFALSAAETLIQVEMNYAPRSGLTRLVEGETLLSVGDSIEAALHNLKASLESTRVRKAPTPLRFERETPSERATGTYGPLRDPRREPELNWNELDGPLEDNYS